MLAMFVFTAILLMLSALASVCETSLTAVNRLKIKVLADDGDKKALKILKLLDKYDSVITSIVIFDNIINIVLPTTSLLFFMSIIQSENLAATVSTVLMTFLVIICGEIVPKIFGRIQSENALKYLVTPLSLFVTFMQPIAFLITKITDFIKEKLFPSKQSEEDFDEEIITMINEEHQQGKLEKKQRDLITKAIMFDDKTVVNIMQPKHKVVMISIDDTNASIYKTLINSRYSRIPVYDPQTNNIVGILNERDFLSNYAINRQFDKQNVIVEPYIIPDSIKISNLLPQMQNSKNQLAVVIDEYGEMQGIITIEDMVEELVGEIWDEHDDVVKKIRRIKENQYLIASDVLLSDLQDIIDINYSEDQTIARFILDKLGKLPAINDSIAEDGYELCIKSMQNNSIDQVLITKL